MNHRKIRLPEFPDIRHVNLARLSALRTYRFYPLPSPPGDTTGTHFCQETLSTPGHRAVGRIRPMKKSKLPHCKSKPPPSGLKQLLHRIPLHRPIMRTNVYGFTRNFIIRNPWGTKSFVVCNLLGISSASDYWMPTFRNTLSVPSSKAGHEVWSVEAFEDGADKVFRNVGIQ